MLDGINGAILIMSIKEFTKRSILNAELKIAKNLFVVPQDIVEAIITNLEYMGTL